MSPERAFGEVLRELRHARGLSQESFAEACGISRPHVSRLEIGRNSPTLSMLFQVAQALKLTPDELIRQARERLENPTTLSE